MHPRFLVAVLVAQSALLAQIGQSPIPFPGGSSGGPLGIPGTQLPIPRRGGRGTGGSTGSTADKPTHIDGTLRRIDGQSVVVEVSDGRVLDFRRTSRTKFYKDSKEVGAADLKPGDQVSVDGTEDNQSYLSAERVTWQAAAKDSTETSQTGATSEAPAPAKPDPDDPGPPVLRRGPPEKPRSSAPDETAAASSDSPPLPPAADDHYILEARDVAADFTAHLPNYACTEFMTRYESTSRPVNWHALDVVSAEIFHETGIETYKNVSIDGKPTHKEMDKLQGSWSTGEFSSLMSDLFSPATAAEFRMVRQATIATKTARVYDFQVDRNHSHWHVETNSQSIYPAYKGSVWIDPEGARVLRIEIQSRAIPVGFPLDTAETVVEFGRVRIGAQDYLLPVHAESLSCERGTSNCSRNSIGFRNYHKYDANSNIQYPTAGN
jgi:hypothetical protein